MGGNRGSNVVVTIRAPVFVVVLWVCDRSLWERNFLISLNNQWQWMYFCFTCYLFVQSCLFVSPCRSGGLRQAATPQLPSDRRLPCLFLCRIAFLFWERQREGESVKFRYLVSVSVSSLRLRLIWQHNREEVVFTNTTHVSEENDGLAYVPWGQGFPIMLFNFPGCWWEFSQVLLAFKPVKGRNKKRGRTERSWKLALNTNVFHREYQRLMSHSCLALPL